jgi:RND family efflux transporter MFP subunit
MRKVIIVLLIVAGAGAGFLFFNRADGRAEQPANGAGGNGRGTGGGAMSAFARPPMTVELAKASRARVTESLLVVGNLIGAATVDVASKVNGRLENVSVRLGDSVRRGQLIATVEDSELQEQVKQADASFGVAAATVRQREADLKFAETSLERSRNLFGRQLIPRQTLDDSEARYQAATAQLDLARAQFEQARARLDELRITLANTRILAPVDGFIGRRNLDPGAFVSSNAAVVSVVDIRFVRLVVNLVEKDLRRVQVGAPAVAEVDAYPGESFTGRVARISPVLDPATRTAEMEIELPNPSYRLKPGMYARVSLTTGVRPDALVVPRNAVVDTETGRGVFLFDSEKRQARFQPVEVGLQDDKQAEVLNGLAEGQAVITTGAASLRDGDPVLLPGMGGGPGGGEGAPGRAGRPGGAPGQGRPGMGQPGGRSETGGQPAKGAGAPQNAAAAIR